MNISGLLDGIEGNLKVKLDELDAGDLEGIQRLTAELNMRDAHIWSALRTLAHAIDKE